MAGRCEACGVWVGYDPHDCVEVLRDRVKDVEDAEEALAVMRTKFRAYVCGSVKNGGDIEKALHYLELD